MNSDSFNIGRLFIVAILTTAVLAACAPSYQSGTYPPSSGAPAQAPTLAPTNIPSSGPTTAPAMTPSANNAPASSNVALEVTSNATLGKFIADGQGRTLYVFLKDTMNTSNCSGGCAQTWPPLISQGQPTVGNGLNAGLLGTTQRKDGSMQVTYNGHPLYHYAPDQKPGDTNGQGIGGIWFVVTADGNPLNNSAAPAAAPTQAPSNPYKYP